MIDSDDIAYFQGRAQEERALSETAETPAIALIHSNLAERYERLARGTHNRPKLHIAVPASNNIDASRQAGS